MFTIVLSLTAFTLKIDYNNLSIQYFLHIKRSLFKVLAAKRRCDNRPVREHRAFFQESFYTLYYYSHSSLNLLCRLFHAEWSARRSPSA